MKDLVSIAQILNEPPGSYLTALHGHIQRVDIERQAEPGRLVVVLRLTDLGALVPVADLLPVAEVAAPPAPVPATVACPYPGCPELVPLAELKAHYEAHRAALMVDPAAGPSTTVIWTSIPQCAHAYDPPPPEDPPPPTPVIWEAGMWAWYDYDAVQIYAVNDETCVIRMSDGDLFNVAPSLLRPMSADEQARVTRSLGRVA